MTERVLDSDYPRIRKFSQSFAFLTSLFQTEKAILVFYILCRKFVQNTIYCVFFIKSAKMLLLHYAKRSGV